MIPFAIPLALKTLPWRWIGIGAGVIAVLLALWWVVDSIGDSREEKVRAEYDAAQRVAEAKAAADTKLLNDAIAEIDQSITIDLEAINAVRTVYRDRVRTIAIDRYRDRDCALPDGLLGEVNRAAQGYAAAASGTGGATVPLAKPTP
jgi:hypothetical protein